MSRYANLHPAVHARRLRPLRGRDLDLTAAGDGERLRRLFFT